MHKRNLRFNDTSRAYLPALVISVSVKCAMCQVRRQTFGTLAHIRMLCDNICKQDRVYTKCQDVCVGTVKHGLPPSDSTFIPFTLLMGHTEGTCPAILGPEPPADIIIIQRQTSDFDIQV
jgi:hypothetical protein